MSKKNSKILSYVVSMLMLLTSFNFSGIKLLFASEICAQDLIISEYLEGSSNNKAIEIYNGTGVDIDLSQYKLELYANGATTATNTEMLTGNLGHGKTYVLFHASANDVIKGKGQKSSTACNFNGDDTLVLKKGEQIVDSFGKLGERPNGSWSSGEVRTVDMTLVRKPSIKAGNANASDIFDPSVEWIAYPKDTTDYLGYHTMDISNPVENKVSNVVASHKSGQVDKGTRIELSTSTTGSSIYFTLDNSEPTVSSILYESPIIVDRQTIIKSFAVKDGLDNSDISVFEYNIKPDINEPITILEARNRTNGSYVSVEGIVISNENGTYIQDNTAGISLSVYGTDFNLNNFKIGDRVKVTGMTGEFRNLKQITLDKAVEVLEENVTLPEPKIISVNEAKSEAYEGQLIKLLNVTVGAYDASTKFTPLTDKHSNSINAYYMPTLTDILIGDKVDVVAIASQYNDYQLKVRFAADVTKADLGPDTIAPTIVHTAITKCNINENLKVIAEITDDRIVSMAKLHYRVKGTSEYTPLDMIKGDNNYSIVVPKENLSLKGLEYYLEASDGTNTITAPNDISNPYGVKISNEDIIGPVISDMEPANGSILDQTQVRPTIKATFVDESGVDVSRIKLYLNDIDITDKATITDTSIVYIPDSNLNKGNHYVTLEVADKLFNSSQVQWMFTIGKTEYNHYYGQLHSHTSYSDGKGTADEAYRWARDNGNADFFAITDHSNWFDDEKNLANETITDVNQSTSNEWKELHSIADSYNKNGEYVALAGFEMTWSGSTGGWGHINTFNTPWFVSRSNSKMDLQTYYSRIAKDTDSISQLNHPGKTFGDFSDFGFYKPEVDNVVNLIEVGNGEGPVRGSGYFPSYEYYIRALDKGWHVAPTNNQDNHKGNFITSNNARTVVLSQELTRDGILNALSERRVYSTEDNNLKINYTINSQQMGSLLDNPQKLNISIEVTDQDSSDSIKTVQLISDGGIVAASKEFSSNMVIWDFELNPQYSYYFVKVVQGDKDIAVTAPIWTSAITPVGISKVSTDQSIVEVNKPINISATVYNNGSEILKDADVNFYINEMTSDNKIGQCKVTNLGQGTTGDALITWKPNEIGEYKIYASVTLVVDGVEKILTATTNIEVQNSDEIVRVLLDAGHMNHYVSGSYAGKMIALRGLLASQKIMLQENPDEITREDLGDVDVLVITSPQPTDDSKNNLKKAKLSPEEIQIIKEFTDRGGSLIVTSRADYKDGTGEYQNSEQANVLLEAIGSNLRVNDAQVIDNSKNEGQPYRLYLGQYTSSKFNLTSNVEVTNYPYSFYSGTSVYLKNGGKDEKVDFLVKGHSTTELSDADNAGDVIQTPKGEVYVLAAEVLSNGAKIVVSGSTFFSDFEITGDNIFSNYTITENVFNWMRPDEEGIEVTSISEVRKDDNKDGIPDNLGKKFKIEGYVTSESEAYTKANNRNNAFFEVLYVQDETGGITVFGVSQEEISLGKKVQITGVVDQYDGDTEISIVNELKDVVVLEEDIREVNPTKVSTKDSMCEENEGLLVRVEGKVTRIDTETDNAIFIDDGSGESRIYVEGYIGDGTGNTNTLGKWDSSIKVGDWISAIGLSSQDPKGHRLRVRNTTEIKKISNDNKEVLIEKITNIDQIEVGNDLKMTVRAKNIIGVNKKVTLIVAIYDENNRMINYVAVTTELQKDETSDLTAYMRVMDNAKVVKCFVWDTLEHMSPLSEVIEIPVIK